MGYAIPVWCYNVVSQIYSGVKKECDSVQNFIVMKSNQKYNKTYPKRYKTHHYVEKSLIFRRITSF